MPIKNTGKCKEIVAEVKCVMSLYSLTPKISLIILLTVCNTIHMMLVWRIWNWIN